MTVHVKFFASLRETVGLEGLTIETHNLAGLRESLATTLSADAFGALCADGVRLAVDQVFFSDDWQNSEADLPMGAEVAFLPPVTGG